MVEDKKTSEDHKKKENELVRIWDEIRILVEKSHGGESKEN